MYKIYSRPRIKFPKFNIKLNNINTFRSNSKNNFPDKNYMKKKSVTKVILILIIAFSTVKIILDAIDPIFEKLCSDKAKSIATIITNEQTSNVMEKYIYEDMFNVEKDVDGNISMVQSDVVAINRIISEISLNIQNSLDEVNKNQISMPLGSFTGFKLISGMGPDVDLTIASTGAITTNLKSEFSSEGINQTLHRVYLEIECDISILTSIKTVDETIVNEVLLIENLIVGIVPSTNYDLEGLSGTDAMEVME